MAIEARLDTEIIRSLMFKASAVCDATGLNCRVVFYTDESGKTVSKTMYSTDKLELDQWLSLKVAMLEIDNKVYQTLTI